MEQVSELTEKQEEAIVALISTSSIGAAAEAAGVGRTTLWRWLRDDGFRSAYMAKRREVMSQATARLQQLTGEAAEVFGSVMNDPGASAHARVMAARAVFELAHKGYELEELEARVQAIEATMS